MQAFVALLRAVNVGGTGKLSMADLTAICEAAGFEGVRTYIASGNAVFKASAAEPQIKAALETRLQAHTGKPACVFVRTAAEMAGIVARNPFPDLPGNRVMVMFLDAPVTTAVLAGMTGKANDEAVRPGDRELYIFYGSGAGNSKLRIPGAKGGTTRNMNTVTKLALMARA